MILAFLLACAATCNPACAKGQTCVPREVCAPDYGGCSTVYECEGVPDDCRTNGCSEADGLECRPSADGYACQPRTCTAAPPEWCLGCSCVEWARGRDCCYDWRYVPEES